MTKKEYLQIALKKIGTKVLPIANDLLVLLEHNQIDDQLLDTLYTTISEYIHTMNEEDKKQKLNTTLQLIDKIRHSEDELKTQDQKEICELECLLDCI